MKRTMGMLMAAVLAGCASHGEATGPAGSLAGLEVHDRTEGKRLQVHWHDGKAYVAGKPGNEYRVTVRSRVGGEDLLAVVSVDGVNVLSGQTADPSQGGYVLAPRSSVDILGWRKSLSQTAAFYFTALPDSYAARTGRPHDVGAIGVALFRRKMAPTPVAPGPATGASSDMARGAPAQAEQSAKIGTGHGRHEASYVRWTAFERATDTPAEVLTLYYDSRANLVARGVIRETVPVAPLPRPFPGFVPDPPRS
ncbi:MAG TPA: hypothetical protein VG873_13050 [Burkholderiales bacterium]|nr:hypothetical protein [Burkholderiales bacterium]